jgi:CDP-4-dehydro-6-deoxyglucose reductase/ferredoxin-NAD(P)+ reductase (naphthalene dioxygenase ferredoxin-specific)
MPGSPPPAMLAHSRPMFCRVVALEEATVDIRIVRLEIVSGGPFRFAAGQYARVTFGEQRPRDYSMASAPDAPYLEFHVRHASTAGASAYVARQLRIGDSVWVEGPFGDAWLRRDHRGPILAIAGGSGLAPIKSIVETAVAGGMTQPIHVYFGARDEADIYLEPHFQALAARHPGLVFEPVLSEPGRPTTRRTGLVVNVVAADLKTVRGLKAYLAGPPPMVEAAVAMLRARGLVAADIHADPFYPMPAASPLPTDRGR